MRINLFTILGWINKENVSFLMVCQLFNDSQCDHLISSNCITLTWRQHALKYLISLYKSQSATTFSLFPFEQIFFFHCDDVDQWSSLPSRKIHSCFSQIIFEHHSLWKSCLPHFHLLCTLNYFFGKFEMPSWLQLMLCKIDPDYSL